MKGTVLLLLLLSFGLNSCKKSIKADAIIKEGPAKVIVNMLGIDETNEPLVPTNGAASGKLASVNKMTNQALSSVDIQTQVVPFNEDYLIEVTLIPEGSPVVSETAGTQGRIAAVRPLTKAAANVTSQTPLTTGVKYKVLVYDAAGNYVISKDYVRGGEGTDGIALEAGKTYTFVVYSVNSTTDLPDAGLTAASTLSTSNLNGVSGDLMYFSTQMTVAAGDNNLGVILKHKYNLITPKITLAPDVVGPISAISNVQFGGTTNASASINLGTGVITYPTTYVLTAASSLSGIGTTTVTGSPVLVINKGTSATAPGGAGSSRLAIGSITIAGVTKTNLSITGLMITPGVKYNLILTIQRSCGTVNWSAANEFAIAAGAAAGGVTTATQTYTYVYNPNSKPVTTVVFYIAQLDESFQMTINGLPLLNKDNEFRLNPGSGATAPNVEEDVSPNRRYGTDGVPTIQASSTTAAFQVDLQLGSSPHVGLHGAVLGNLRIIPGSGYTVNTAAVSSWNTSGNNTVTITQKLIGTTTIFKARTALVIPCTN